MLPTVYFSPCRVLILFSTVVAAKFSFGGKPKLNLAKQPDTETFLKKNKKKQDPYQWLHGMMGKNNKDNINNNKK